LRANSASRNHSPPISTVSTSVQNLRLTWVSGSRLPELSIRTSDVVVPDRRMRLDRPQPVVSARDVDDVGAVVLSVGCRPGTSAADAAYLVVDVEVGIEFEVGCHHTE